MDAIVQFFESARQSTAGSAGLLAGGIVLLLGGGHWLVQGAIVLASRLGVSTLVIGLTVVAFGTSAPELAFNLIAAAQGNPDLSFGNIVGSNIANIGLVVGLSALVLPLAVSSRVIEKELPWLVGVSFGCLILAAVPPQVQLPGGVTRFGFTWIDGLIMLACFAGFTWTWYRLGRSNTHDPLTEESTSAAREQTRGAAWAAIGLFVLGLALLLAGGKLSEMGAVGLATAMGLSNALIGLTVVALATSLPEITTSLLATRKGHADLAVGNVVGSNLFNLLLVLGITSLVAPVPLPAQTLLGPIQRGWFDLSFMCFLTLVLLPIAVSHGHRVTKLEGVLLLGSYVVYMAVSIIAELS